MLYFMCSLPKKILPLKKSDFYLKILKLESYMADLMVRLSVFL